ncbi:MAG: DUF4249 domain-containing protein [Bacteroidota bacterium]
MLRTGPKSIAVLIALFAFCTCIDPYFPKLDKYESLMVIDGLITNANSAYTVKLSRTFQEQNSGFSGISDATVFISDDKGEKSYLINTGNGIYKTDSTEFRGVVGRTYVLHILTGENNEYESEPCVMLPVPDIDSIYIAKDQKLVNNNTESQEGVSIYLDSKGGDINRYYRWTYDETWKIEVPTPKNFNYVKGPNPNDPIFVAVADVKDVCWKKRQSDEILIRSVNEGQTEKIEKQPVFFIATEKSDRLLLQYSILVKQYSISKNEYEFWNNLKQVNETGSDIFARQPYTVISNIHSSKNPEERVLGFFQVSAVSQKRKNIPYRDVALMGLHFYSYPCKIWEFEPGDFETICRCPPKTWDDVYWYLSIVSDYTFIEPKLNLAEDSLLKLVFTRPECADCTVAGTHVKPDFWDEFNN